MRFHETSCDTKSVESWLNENVRLRDIHAFVTEKNTTHGKRNFNP